MKGTSARETRRVELSWLSGEIWGALNEVLRADEGELRRGWNSAGMQGRRKREIPEKTPPTSGIVRHDSHLRKSGSGPAGDSTRFALVGSEQSNRSATAAPSETGRDQVLRFSLAEERSPGVKWANRNTEEHSERSPVQVVNKGLQTCIRRNKREAFPSTRAFQVGRHGLETVGNNFMEGFGRCLPSFHTRGSSLYPTGVVFHYGASSFLHFFTCETTVSLLASHHQGDPGSIPGRITPGFGTWDSCRTMLLVGGFFRGSSVSPSFHFGAAPYSPQSPSLALKTSMLRTILIFSLPSRLRAAVSGQAVIGMKMKIANQLIHFQGKVLNPAIAPPRSVRKRLPVWAALNVRILRAGEDEARPRVCSSTGMLAGECLAPSPPASSSTIPTYENPVTRPGIEPGSHWWEASRLTTQPPWPQNRMIKNTTFVFQGSRLPGDSFPRLRPGSAENDKGDTATLDKYSVAAKRKAFNWRVVFSSSRMYRLFTSRMRGRYEAVAAGDGGAASGRAGRVTRSLAARSRTATPVISSSSAPLQLRGTSFPGRSLPTPPYERLIGTRSATRTLHASSEPALEPSLHDTQFLLPSVIPMGITEGLTIAIAEEKKERISSYPHEQKRQQKMGMKTAKEMDIVPVGRTGANRSQGETPYACKRRKSCKETCIAAERDWAAMASDWGHEYLPNSPASHQGDRKFSHVGNVADVAGSRWRLLGHYRILQHCIVFPVPSPSPPHIAPKEVGTEQCRDVTADETPDHRENFRPATSSWHDSHRAGHPATGVRNRSPYMIRSRFPRVWETRRMARRGLYPDHCRLPSVVVVYSPRSPIKYRSHFTPCAQGRQPPTAPGSSVPKFSPAARRQAEIWSAMDVRCSPEEYPTTTGTTDPPNPS
ncbi:hypothetical protein PR048_003217 [Dryococelus australis]|uniref:Uncharacterized protein n=1 Tax=Dryococelus australis TaxID=614101 RepID=A0ABQ9INS7_9NEOP|nr:hypothetical protein PR048_003217 [Dryococelus australis]